MLAVLPVHRQQLSAHARSAANVNARHVKPGRGLHAGHRRRAWPEVVLAEFRQNWPDLGMMDEVMAQVNKAMAKPMERRELPPKPVSSMPTNMGKL